MEQGPLINQIASKSHIRLLHAIALILAWTTTGDCAPNIFALAATHRSILTSWSARPRIGLATSLSCSWQLTFNQMWIEIVGRPFDMIHWFAISRCNGSAWLLLAVYLRINRQGRLCDLIYSTDCHVFIAWQFEGRVVLYLLTPIKLSIFSQLLMAFCLLLGTSVHYICPQARRCLRLSRIECLSKCLLLDLQIFASYLALFTAHQVLISKVREHIANRYCFLRYGRVLQVLKSLIKPSIFLWHGKQCSITRYSSVDSMHRAWRLVMATFD